MDCMDYMRGLPDNAFELAIVDPPYGIDWNKQTKNVNTGKNWIQHEYKDWDGKSPTPEYFKELYRVSKNQIIWGGNYFLDYLNPTPCFLIWDKKMTDKHLMSMSEFAWTSFRTKNLIFRQPPVGDRGFYNIDGTRIHPTQKSIKLYEWQLMNYAKEGDKILDTHRGSASLDIACHNLGFDLVTCEIDTDYFNDGNKRLKQHQQQQVINFEL